MEQRDGERGVALLSALVLLVCLVTVLAACWLLADFERSSARATMATTRGHYAAEAAVNLRLDTLRSTFLGFNRPAGSSPPPSPGQLPCQGAQGSGDFICQALSFPGRTALSLIDEDVANPRQILIPRGELYQNLRAQEYSYLVRGVSVDSRNRAEAIVDMGVRVRLVPLFQFAAFYNKDLEILPGPTMNFAGPVHSNGNLYLDAGTSLTVNGQVTTAGKLFRGRKDVNTCNAKPVQVYDPASALDLPACSGTRREIVQAELTPWNGMIETGVDITQVPPPSDLDPTPGALYWDRADVRIVLDLNGGPPTVQVRDAAGSTDAASTALLNACGCATTSATLYNHRESATIRMLDVDVGALMDCVQANPAIAGGRALDDSTDGGLVWYLGVDGPGSNGVNSYGVRVIGAADLSSSTPGAPIPRGLTVVTNQALYVQGDYNSANKKPAGLLGDSFNMLSNAWNDASSAGGIGGRVASSTTLNAALLAGTDTTAGVEGVAGQDAGVYNGGLENYPRFHEDWAGKTFTYRGSLVSLGRPLHVAGPWGNQSYSPPNRDWDYDTSFNDAGGLPPLSPRFIHVVQGRFAREFEL